MEYRVPWQSRGSGQTHGLEIYAKVKPIGRWKIGIGVTELRGNYANLAGPMNLPADNTPHHLFNVQSRFNVTPKVEFDSGLYHVDGIRGYSSSGVLYQDVRTHNRLDIGLTWRNNRGFTFSIWGRDLTGGPHWENRSSTFFTSGSQVRGRIVAFKVMWESRSIH